jgi:CGNR zinc finger protein
MSEPQIQKFTLPIAALLDVQEEWKVSMSGGSDPEYSFERTRNVAYRRVDSFDVREDFLNVRTPEDALKFFRHYGPFQITPPKTGSEKKRGPEVRVDPIRWSFIQRTQEDFREALLADGIPVEKRWLYDFIFGRPLTIELWFQAVMPATSSRAFKQAASNEDAAIAHCNDVVDALRATVFLTRMGEFKWRRCARPGCDQIFIQNHGRQIYCGESCARRVAQSAYEAREKNKSLKKLSRVGRAKRKPPTKGKSR